LQRLCQRYSGRVGVSIGFDTALAHKIEAGSDLFLMPSRFEPCGLSQMYSLRYGSVPIVHATGGLDDTIEAYEPASERGNGFKFAPYDAEALLATLQRALTLYHDRTAWVRLMQRGMQADHSWLKSAQAYADLYATALERRRGAAVLV
jgi:starch synthase